MANDFIAAEHHAAFLRAAWHFQVWILVRSDNPAGRRFYGLPGYYPKPLDIKAKTAKTDIGNYQLAGLVASPEIHTSAFGGRDFADVKRLWEKSLSHIYIPEPGSTRLYLPPGKLYSIETNPNEKHYGCVYYTLYGLATKKLFVCGDYDLYGLISAKDPTEHLFVEETMRDSKHVRTPELRDVQFYLNRELGIPMIQHGAQESFLEHQEDKVIAFHPDGKTVTLLNSKSEIEAFYQKELGGRQTAGKSVPKGPAGGNWQRVGG